MIITRSQARSIAIFFAALACTTSTTRAQVTRLGGFNPPELGTIEGLGYNPMTDTLWVFPQRSTHLYEYSREGELLRQINSPYAYGRTSNDPSIPPVPITSADITFIAQPAILQLVNWGNPFGQVQVGPAQLPPGSMIMISGEPDLLYRRPSDGQYPSAIWASDLLSHGSSTGPETYFFTGVLARFNVDDFGNSEVLGGA